MKTECRGASMNRNFTSLYVPVIEEFATEPVFLNPINYLLGDPDDKGWPSLHPN